MQLSAPIFRLKRDAKHLARAQGLPLHAALDQTAAAQGFQSWSHLMSASDPTPAERLMSELAPGDMVLLGARPGQGKTLLGLELALRAPQLDRVGMFFTLDYHERDVVERARALGHDPATGRLVLDTSDEISAAHIISRLKGQRALAVVDYLQLLDQKRTTPPLEEQIAALREVTRQSGAICVMISQIHRGFDLSGRVMPDASDVRLPNPLDLTLFDWLCFLHKGQMQLTRTEAVKGM